MTDQNEMVVAQTSVTRGRIDKLVQRFGAEKLEHALSTCKDDEQASRLLDALCIAWFGKITPKWPRSDKGRWDTPPERAWQRTCLRCDRNFDAARHDACYCSNACRQATYRARNKAVAQ